jgi:peptidylprolyl isomerase
MKIKKSTLVIFIILVVVIGLGIWYSMAGQTPSTKTSAGGTVTLKTTVGDIVIELDANMPITAGNFKKLVSEKFYDGTIFHRVIEDFMIQGGDPTGSGRGGPGYTIKDEFSKGNTNLRGTISMANSGPNTGGSQFFINTANNTFLDGKHPVFGKVTKGMEVVDKISRLQKDRNDRPMIDVKIVSATLA